MDDDKRDASAHAPSRKGRDTRPPRPLTPEGLTELALAYVSRFATSKARLARYLLRKLHERGWHGETPADIDALVERLAGYGYVDDAAYAEARARSLARRGYGQRRIATALHGAGIAESERAGARQVAADERIGSALRLAQRRRWGPYADEPLRDPALREKRLAAFLRAGHDARLARAILALGPGQAVDGLE